MFLKVELVKRFLRTCDGLNSISEYGYDLDLDLVMIVINGRESIYLSNLQETKVKLIVNFGT